MIEQTPLVPSPDHLAMARQYPPIIQRSDVEDAYVASVPDLPHLVGVGDTPEEAVAEAIQQIAEALALREELGRVSPSPSTNASGLFQARAPRTLHQALVLRADLEGVSVNALVNHLLTRALALEEAVELPKPRRPRAAKSAA